VTATELRSINRFGLEEWLLSRAPTQRSTALGPTYFQGQRKSDLHSRHHDHCFKVPDVLVLSEYPCRKFIVVFNVPNGDHQYEISAASDDVALHDLGHGFHEPFEFIQQVDAFSFDLNENKHHERQAHFRWVEHRYVLLYELLVPQPLDTPQAGRRTQSNLGCQRLIADLIVALEIVEDAPVKIVKGCGINCHLIS